MKITEEIKKLISHLEIIQIDAFRFDNGNNRAGLRTRKSLIQVTKKMVLLRKEIQRLRYYRDALAMYIGKRTYIEKLAYKEKKHGKVDKVAKLQIIQNRKDRFLSKG